MDGCGDRVSIDDNNERIVIAWLEMWLRCEALPIMEGSNVKWTFECGEVLQDKFPPINQ